MIIALASCLQDINVMPAIDTPTPMSSYDQLQKIKEIAADPNFAKRHGSSRAKTYARLLAKLEDIRETLRHKRNEFGSQGRESQDEMYLDMMEKDLDDFQEEIRIKSRDCQSEGGQDTEGGASL